MSKNRYSAKIDANQPEIVKQLRQLGYTVQTGVDDILVGAKGKTFWFEIKDPEKALNKNGTYRSGAIKDSQKKLSNEWKGHYRIVHSLQQILDEIKEAG